MTLFVVFQGDPANQKLGDCPFCHRVLLSLNQKVRKRWNASLRNLLLQGGCLSSQARK